MTKTHPCPKCGFASTSDTECLRCGIVFDKFNNIAIHPVEPPETTDDGQESLIVDSETDLIAPVFFNFKVNALSLPVGLLAAFVLQKFWVFHYLVFLFCVIPLHELGHAFAAWMTGRFALPIGAIVPTAGMTLIGNEQHLWVHLIYFGFFAFLAFIAWKKKVYSVVVLAAIFTLASFSQISSLKPEQIGPFISYGGIAGEFLLSSLLIISFYQPLFKKMRWDFFRYPFFIMGCMAFTNACSMWLRIQSKLQSLPFGTAISADGAGDSNGDMNRLIQAGWSESMIISKYLTLGKIAFTCILIQYIYSLIASRNKSI